MLHETEVKLGSFFFSEYFPFIGWVDKLTGMKRRLENNFKELDLFFQEIIQDHSDSKVPKNGQQDIIDVLLRIQKDGGLKVDVTWDHIKAILMVIYIFLNTKNNSKYFSFKLQILIPLCNLILFLCRMYMLVP
ncbi:hypothetical protein Pint_08300 [Pistacia integerrima]|uniref:Uncharacterized protein n=1 Tax=Pistacia integerrima TaxID=434235 RepID=A0ACC0XZA3_9ROSI|nr:hypothetical protein Pint_08300 [Pistacia integerrima]